MEGEVCKDESGWLAGFRLEELVAGDDSIGLGGSSCEEGSDNKGGRGKREGEVVSK